MGWLGLKVVAVAVLVGVAGLGQAQQLPTPDQQGQFRSPILTIDVDRLFGETLFGIRVLEELGRATDELAAENRSIEAELKTEEQNLTEARPNMEVDAFRTAAEAFDIKVQQIRQEQDTKELELQQTLASEREAFLASVTPVLGQLMIDSGAVAILDRRSVFLGVGIIDVTEQAVAAIDAELGDGAANSTEPQE